MANTYSIKSPEPPNGGVPTSVVLKQVGGNFYAYAAGANMSNPPNQFTAVKGMVFSDQAAATAAANGVPGGDWATASIPGGYYFNFGAGEGQGTIPGAQLGLKNYLVVLAQFQGSNSWVQAQSDAYQFKGASVVQGSICIPKAGFYRAATAKKPKKSATRKAALARKKSRTEK
jgi:hypothetical protein